MLPQQRQARRIENNINNPNNNRKMKYFSISLLLFCIFAQQMSAQVKRTDEFHQKYQLSQVAVFSRHNIRAPLAKPGSFISTITPHEWHDFGVDASELTMKGGVLETINGQFFHQWVVSEGLFPENAIPTDDEVVFVSNSKQRTISTARHFASSFMPMKTINVQHEGNINDMDPLFNMNLESDVTADEWVQIESETAERYDAEALRKVSESLKPNFDLLSEVLDIKNSPAYLDGSFTGFNNHNCQIVYEIGKEPEVTASLNQACQPVDALILQYYEEQDPQKVAFGMDLTDEQWQALYNIIHTKDMVRFCSPWVNRHVSKAQRQFIADALQLPSRKFTFLCGHDTNILNILKALRVKDYVTTNAIEIGTPIGSKIVFEKWIDASGKAFVAVNHIYQTADQLRNNTMLNLTTPPNIIPLQLDGMTPDENGLYPLDQMLDRLTDRDVPSAITTLTASPEYVTSASYNLSGQRVSEAYHGIVIRDNKTFVSSTVR